MKDTRQALQTILKLINETTEQWVSVFDGTPEDQMAALEILADARDSIVTLLKKKDQQS